MKFIQHIIQVVLLVAIAVLLLAGCRKEPEVIPDNAPPDYDGVPSVLVRNYVNRLYIDLIGREPVDAEMDADVQYLRSGDLSHQVRTALVVRIMTDTSWVEGDSSYAHAYYRRQYDMYKSRFLEGASDAVIDDFIGQALQAALEDSLSGDTGALAGSNMEVVKLRNVQRIPIQYRRGEIGLKEVHRRLVFNSVYDHIHMNAFNFVNATFDNFYFRTPTTTEFSTAYNMVEHSAAGTLFGQSGQSKGEYVTIATNHAEYFEGMVRWCYQTLLGRLPSAQEVYSILPSFQVDQDLQSVQRNILISDEYAGFGQ